MSLRSLQFFKLITPKLANDIFGNLEHRFKTAQIMELYQVLDIIVELNIEQLYQLTLGKKEIDYVEVREMLQKEPDA